MEIKLNPVFSVISPELIPHAAKTLSFESAYYRTDKDTGRKTRVSYRKSAVTGVNVPTGLIPRLVSSLRAIGRDDIQFVPGRKSVALALKEFSIKPLRPHQKMAVATGLQRKRGVIVAPTRSGKTLIAATILNSMPASSKVLFVVPSKTLLKQTAEEFRTLFAGERIGMVGDGDMRVERVTVALINSLAKVNTGSYFNEIEAIIADECHSISSFEGTWSKTLSKINAPIRIGLTATPPPHDTEAEFAMEGTLGPIIHEIQAEALYAENLIVRPEIEFVIPPPKAMHNLRKFDEFYDAGVTSHEGRHDLIAQITMEEINAGESVLIVVKIVEHGHALHKILHPLLGDSCRYIHGTSDGDLREETRKELANQEIKAVIASAIWKQGVDIPRLSVIINAAGYKSFIPVVQLSGRGLTASDGKITYRMIDFMDHGKYLADHSVKRAQIFMQRGYKVKFRGQ